MEMSDSAPHLGPQLGVLWDAGGHGYLGLSRLPGSLFLQLWFRLPISPCALLWSNDTALTEKMCCSKLCVAPVANLIYTMGNRKAFFIWLNSQLWHEIFFLISTCWKCYDNKNAFFFFFPSCWESKKNLHFFSCITATAFFGILWV